MTSISSVCAYNCVNSSALLAALLGLFVNQKRLELSPGLPLRFRSQSALHRCYSLDNL